ncbi:MAG: aspartate aminotransferase family protein [Gammaproteobacteria bacterium]|jgi:alanine-glyoxylate transaminase/(R)-3-amino-2-methylpropionate-pyruvate transaminase|nr:aspartate aminotransferase family protein [Gammaproteobacteria bacterium]
MPSQFDHDQHELELDWDTDAIVGRRNRYYAASQRAFVPYQQPLIFSKGQDQYLWDEKGNRYLDCLSQNLTISVGYNNPVVTRAVTRQAQTLQHCTTMFFHPMPAHYAEELTRTMPAGEEWVVHLMNSGAEAIDMALLLARCYTGNIDTLSLTNSYHGATFGAQSVTGIGAFRHNVPLLGGIQFVPVPDPYRGIHGACVEPYLDDLDASIHYATSGRLAGMLLEPIQGYGGIIPLPEGYISGALERVHAAGGLLIVDEVQSGMARTGEHFWAFQKHAIVPDIVVAAKGLGNGYPLAAVIVKREIAEAMSSKFYFHTYGANPVNCAAGRAVLHVIEQHMLQQRAREVGGALLAVLEELQTRHPVIGAVRGRGMMMAIELVKNRDSREPDPETMLRLFEKTREFGLVASKSGAYRNVLRICPPLCMQMDDVSFFADAINKSFDSL